MSRVGTLLQLDERTWSTISHQELSGRIMTVLFAYGIVAWNRFGLLSFTSPRAPVRLVLVGIYSWLILAALIWLAARRGERDLAPRDAAVAAAIVQVPIVALGFFMAIIGGFARIFGPGLILAIIVFTLWVPALLIRAFRTAAGLPPGAGTAAALLVHAAWIALPGRWFYDQVGHLL